MNKISTDELMEYLDNRLSGERAAVVEAYLRENPEEAEEVAMMRLASQALQDYDSTLPTQASADFWPSLRERLPAQPGNSWFRRLGLKPNGWAMPTLRLSIGAAVAAAVIAMIAFMSAPQQSTPSLSANQLTPDDEAFITQSLQRHETYSATQPGALGLSMTPGDAQSAEHGEYDDEEYIP